MDVEDFKKKYEQLKDNPMYKNFCSILDTKSQVLERTAKENQQLKEQLEASEKARNNCYKYLKNPPEDVWSGHSIEKAIELLDIDKGE